MRSSLFNYCCRPSTNSATKRPGPWVARPLSGSGPGLDAIIAGVARLVGDDADLAKKLSFHFGNHPSGARLREIGESLK